MVKTTICYLIRKSAMMLNMVAVAHMAPYGMAVQIPIAVDVVISSKFFFRYCGSSVMRRWKPQLLPMLDIMIAQNGTEVQIAFQGMGKATALVAGRPAVM